MRFLTTIAIMLWIAATVAAAPDVPPIVGEGLEMYQKKRGDDALAVWLKGSPIENDTATKKQFEGYFTLIDKLYGKMLSYELVRVVPVAPSYERVYLIARHERGPVFYVFDCYRSDAGWIIPTFELNTRAKEVLPPQILSGTSQ